MLTKSCIDIRGHGPCLSLQMKRSMSVSWCVDLTDFSCLPFILSFNCRLGFNNLSTSELLISVRLVRPACDLNRHSALGELCWPFLFPYLYETHTLTADEHGTTDFPTHAGKSLFHLFSYLINQ